jgi:hypothetical protein
MRARKRTRTGSELAQSFLFVDQLGSSFYLFSSCFCVISISRNVEVVRHTLPRRRSPHLLHADQNGPTRDELLVVWYRLLERSAQSVLTTPPGNLDLTRSKMPWCVYPHPTNTRRIRDDYLRCMEDLIQRQDNGSVDRVTCLSNDVCAS